MAFRRLDDLAVHPGDRVLVRVDYNVPLEGGRITDDTRIRESLPTLRELLDRGAALILMSHLGRPRGHADPALSLRPVAERLGELLARPVRFVAAVAGEPVAAAARGLGAGDILMLENLRFDPREEANDPGLARELASLARYYVDDAFGSAHRAHASTAGVPALLPSAAGRLMERELWALAELLGHPERPYWAVVGGAKVADKTTLLRRLMDQVDGLVIGGGMANTFLAAEGVDMGASRVEDEVLPLARELLADARARGRRVLLPVDVVAAAAFRADAPARVTRPGNLAAGEMALDIGPGTVQEILAVLGAARTVFWNGPLGVFEWDRFSEGTMAVARGLAALSARVVVGGGDSAAAVAKAGVADRLTHISTGGGAALEFLEGRELPGVVALEASHG
jgi:phosphoglycerate kinase